MAILITGLGYIGSQLAEDLLAAGQTVVALENFFCTTQAQLRKIASRPGLTLLRGSINSPSMLRAAFQQHSIESVVHLAAQPSAHPQAASASYTERTNLVGARLTLEAAQAAGVKRIVLGSSFKVYGDTLSPVVTEQQPYGRVGDLAHLSKIYVEKLAEMLAATSGIPTVSVRLGITYGLAPVMKSDRRFMTVPNLFALLAARGQPLTIHPPATRPAGFIQVADASAALRAALTMPTRETYTAVNAVSECLAVGQVARQVTAAARARGLSVTLEGPTMATGEAPRVESSLPPSVVQQYRRLEDSVGDVLDYFLRQAP